MKHGWLDLFDATIHHVWVKVFSGLSHLTLCGILRVTFDLGFKFNAHVKSIITRASQRVNILKALAGTNWDQQKETIDITYMSFIRSFSMYAALIWFLNTSPSLIQKLKTIQNSALRWPRIHHVHEETKMHPVQDHLSQYFAWA